MEKIIIQNESNLSLLDAIECVKQVVGLGRISNNNTQYCYVTKIPIKGIPYIVYADRNGKSDKFKIM